MLRDKNCQAVLLSFVSLLVALTACNLPPSGSPTATLPPTATVPPQPVATDTPTPTPTPQVGLVVLLAPAGSDAAQVAALQPLLSDLSTQAGLGFEKRDQLGAMDQANLPRLIVALSPDPGVANLAQANPETQFLAIGIPDVTAGQNLSSIGAGGGRPDQEAFLAGYLAAVITQDWRVGVISPSDTPAGQAAQLGFVNGVVFYCGLCRPAYPPFVQYPVYAGLPGGSDPAAQQAAADTLIKNGVKTVYVYPGAAEATVLDYLAQKKVNLIGGATPPEQIRSRWVATVSTDLASGLKNIWPRLMTGETGLSVEVPLAITDRNGDLFSPGRQQLVEKMLAEMLDGYIDTGVDPKTGKAR